MTLLIAVCTQREPHSKYLFCFTVLYILPVIAGQGDIATSEKKCNDVYLHSHYKINSYGLLSNT